MENSLGILVEYLGLPSHKKSETIHLDPRILILDKNEDMIGNVLKLRLLFLLVKSFLQNAAVNSQLMKHETALRNANLGKFYFKLLIHNMEYMIGLYVKLTKQVELKASSRSRQEDDMAYFAPELDIPELRRFQRLVSNSVLHDFAKFSKEVLENDPTELINRQANERNELSNVIFWKHNSENNEKYFKKELAARSRDLGVSSKLTTAGLKDFNIGNVMHIKPISINKLNEEVEFTDYFGVKLAVEILLTYCCCLFSIATENRFICQKEFEAESKINEFKGGSIESKKSLKIYKLQKNRNFVAS